MGLIAWIQPIVAHFFSPAGHVVELQKKNEALHEKIKRFEELQASDDLLFAEEKKVVSEVDALFRKMQEHVTTCNQVKQELLSKITEQETLLQNKVAALQTIMNCDNVEELKRLNEKLLCIAAEKTKTACLVSELERTSKNLVAFLQL